MRMPSPENTYALILAGGSGTRFWPLSRNDKPKQLLDLFGNGTLLEETINRLAGLVPVENILILTNSLQVDLFYRYTECNVFGNAGIC